MGRILVAFGVDVDAVAGWLGSYGGEDSPADISRGLFAGEVGVPRLLKLFTKHGIKTSWFIPGHSLDTFPEQLAAVRDAGHEIGLHGYSHENPTSLTIEQQRDILNRTWDQMVAFTGKAPEGSVAPWWEASAEGTKLLLDKGIRYDHSLQHRDSQAYFVRINDSWKKIDYEQPAASWMEPVKRGEDTGLVEIPVNWDLDDLPPMLFMKTAANSHGFVDAHVIEQKWKDWFEYLYENEREEGFIMPITIHPDVSGRPHVLQMIDRFIRWINTHDGVEWVTFKEIEADFRARHKPAPGALMPKGVL
ncbi:Peptidoglycan deacetylase [Vanrija pseudolonga]|uniref:Peptidoglycan deacetylase n=1 Tax=Vanrija pseudolonga TaxID=143232 RepID=A0AAF0YD30_9TREE|nr:Peptidoglycan deacetylase [Vanrija pseudolonga]